MSPALRVSIFSGGVFSTERTSTLIPTTIVCPPPKKNERECSFKWVNLNPNKYVSEPPPPLPSSPARSRLVPELHQLSVAAVGQELQACARHAGEEEKKSFLARIEPAGNVLLVTLEDNLAIAKNSLLVNICSCRQPNPNPTQLLTPLGLQTQKLSEKTADYSIDHMKQSELLVV